MSIETKYIECQLATGHENTILIALSELEDYVNGGHAEAKVLWRELSLLRQFIVNEFYGGGQSEGANVSNLWDMLTKTHLVAKKRPHRCKKMQVPYSFRRLNSLQSLTMDDCGLDNIPQSVIELRGLRWLSLKKNNIAKLPANFNYHANMKVVDLRQNPISAQFDLTDDLNWIYEVLPKDCKVLH